MVQFGINIKFLINITSFSHFIIYIFLKIFYLIFKNEKIINIINPSHYFFSVEHTPTL